MGVVKLSFDQHVRIALRVRIAIFCALIGLPGVLGVTGVSGWKGFVENRRLAEFPWTAPQDGALRATTKGIDAYFSDHFAFRPLLIYAVNWSKLMIGASSTPDVMLGTQNWMFLTDLADYRGLSVVQPSAIADWRAKYIERRVWVEQFGAHFLLVIAPRKGTVYPEYMPGYARPRGDQTRRRLFLDALRPGTDILDLTDPLRAAKAFGQLYYRYDTHWNFLGAYQGARAIVNYLHARYQDVPRFDDNNFTLEPLRNERQTFGDTGWFNLGVRIGVPFLTDSDTVIVRNGGWTTKMQVRTVRRHMLVYTFTKDDPKLPTVVVYADSFGYPLKRLIAEHFRRAVFVNPFEDEETPADEFPADIVERERPDYFIYLRWEYAAFVPPDNPPEVR
jgi:alginate O-acetyltransferase complex protein AlgJ